MSFVHLNEVNGNKGLETSRNYPVDKQNNSHFIKASHLNTNTNTNGKTYTNKPKSVDNCNEKMKLFAICKHSLRNMSLD